jgi:hypothetical protein
MKRSEENFQALSESIVGKYYCYRVTSARRKAPKPLDSLLNKEVLGGGGFLQGKRGKGKSRPITYHESTDGEDSYSYTFSLTSVLECRWVVNATARSLYSQGIIRYPLCRRLHGLDGCEKSRFHRESMSWPSSLSPVTIPTMPSRSPGPIRLLQNTICWTWWSPFR